MRLATEKLAAKKQMDRTHEHTPATNEQAQVVDANVFYDTTNRFARVGK